MAQRFQVKLNTKYRLLNLETGTYLTRSKDKVSIVGNKFTHEMCQDWVFQSSGDDYTIKAADAIQYLTVPINHVGESQQLQCARTPAIWKLWKVDNMATVARLTPMLNDNLYVDLNGANQEDGTKITLWQHSGNNQLWVLEEVNKDQ